MAVFFHCKSKKEMVGFAPSSIAVWTRQTRHRSTSQRIAGVCNSVSAFPKRGTQGFAKGTLGSSGLLHRFHKIKTSRSCSSARSGGGGWVANAGLILVGLRNVYFQGFLLSPAPVMTLNHSYCNSSRKDVSVQGPSSPIWHVPASAESPSAWWVSPCNLSDAHLWIMLSTGIFMRESGFSRNPVAKQRVWL